MLAEVDGRRFQVTLRVPEPPYAELARRRRDRDGDTTGGSAGREAVVSPMQGTVLAVEVADGDEVREGQVICIVEAMKMENEITAHRRGVVSGLSVQAGEPVQYGPGDLHRRPRGRSRLARHARRRRRGTMTGVKSCIRT